MRTSQRAGVAIIKDSKILLIKRIKNDEQYYILPGGGVESEETPLDAAIREVKEELGIKVNIVDQIAEFEHRGNIEYYYIAKDFAGEINGNGDSNLNDAIHDEVLWLDVSQIEKINLLPAKIKAILIEKISNLD